MKYLMNAILVCAAGSYAGILQGKGTFKSGIESGARAARGKGFGKY